MDTVFVLRKWTRYLCGNGYCLCGNVKMDVTFCMLTIRNAKMDTALLCENGHYMFREHWNGHRHMCYVKMGTVYTFMWKLTRCLLYKNAIVLKNRHYELYAKMNTIYLCGHGHDMFFLKSCFPKRKYARHMLCENGHIISMRQLTLYQWCTNWYYMFLWTWTLYFSCEDWHCMFWKPTLCFYIIIGTISCMWKWTLDVLCEDGHYILNVEICW